VSRLKVKTSDRTFIPGYGGYCAVCPFCHQLNCASADETRCPHFLAWSEPLYDGATFSRAGDAIEQEALR